MFELKPPTFSPTPFEIGEALGRANASHGIPFGLPCRGCAIYALNDLGIAPTVEKVDQFFKGFEAGYLRFNKEALLLLQTEETKP